MDWMFPKIAKLTHFPTGLDSVAETPQPGAKYPMFLRHAFIRRQRARAASSAGKTQYASWTDI